MYTGFNLHLNKDSGIFSEYPGFTAFSIVGKNHLNEQQAKYERDLNEYVWRKEINGSKIQEEWFPQIEADIFISHSHKDKELACALAGWINSYFGLKCFIDANVWGYSEELLEEMNGELSNKRSDGEGGYLYNHQSCNQVSQHVNTMLSIALQKMIDKTEAVFFLNTDNAVKVYDGGQMNTTYSPWIYSEIICTQIVRKKPLLAYRDYTMERKSYTALSESKQFLMHSAISYQVSLDHLKLLKKEDLSKWRKWYEEKKENYKYALDALYECMGFEDVENTKKLFEALGDDELNALHHAYSTQDMNSESWGSEGRIWDEIMCRGLSC